MDWVWIYYVLIGIFLLLSAFFSGSETALFALDEVRQKRITEKEVKKRIGDMLRQSSRLLITILFANTLVNTTVSALLETQLPFQNPLITTAIVTIIILIFGEIAPKTIALIRPEGLSKFVSGIIYFFFNLLKPITNILEKLTESLLKFVKRFHREKDISDMDKDHLSALISIVSREGIFDKDEKLLVESILRFASREVWNIMTPRTKVVCIEQGKSIPELVQLLKKSKFSKIPVYQKTNDNIVGVVYIRTAMSYIHNPDKIGKKTVGEIMEKMYFVPETKKLSEMLEDFRKKHIRIATVVDEYGYSLGIVTIADVLGEIVGELIDESFVMDKRILRTAPHQYHVKGDTGLDDFNNFFKTELSSEEYETIAGYIIEKTGDIPDRGFSLDIGNYNLIVMGKSEQHIESIAVEKKKRT